MHDSPRPGFSIAPGEAGWTGWGVDPENTRFQSAKAAGLDPTTFNKSKRITVEGRPRWPSTESISKALTATGTTLQNFVALVEGSGIVPARAAWF